jgi:hypothetical protein
LARHPLFAGGHPGGKVINWQNRAWSGMEVVMVRLALIDAPNGGCWLSGRCLETGGGLRGTTDGYQDQRS